jgi:TrpR family trp operon transcriptional repressor
LDSRFRGNDEKRLFDIKNEFLEVALIIGGFYMKAQMVDVDWQEFLKFCAQLKTAQQFNSFFELFLTINEREELLARFKIIKELLKGEKTQREIADYHNVSIAKITRGSNQLKIIDEAFKKFVKKKICLEL